MASAFVDQREEGRRCAHTWGPADTRVEQGRTTKGEMIGRMTGDATHPLLVGVLRAKGDEHLLRVPVEKRRKV